MLEKTKIGLLITGLALFLSVNTTKAQECKSAERLAQENASSEELTQQREYWLAKFKGGAKNLSGAYLKDADLHGLDFSGVNLVRADLTGANLSGANFLYANLNWLNAPRANFSGADMSEVSLHNADLTFADLSNVNFLGAKAKDVKLADGQRLVRLSVEAMTCTFSDDEGPSNDVDMAHFKITVNGKPFYEWKGDAITTSVGFVWPVKKETLVYFTNYADIVVEGEAYEEDLPNILERGVGSANVHPGFSHGGECMNISLNGEFSFSVPISTEIVSKGR